MVDRMDMLKATLTVMRLAIKLACNLVILKVDMKGDLLGACLVENSAVLKDWKLEVW